MERQWEVVEETKIVEEARGIIARTAVKNAVKDDVERSGRGGRAGKIRPQMEKNNGRDERNGEAGGPIRTIRGMMDNGAAGKRWIFLVWVFLCMDPGLCIQHGVRSGYSFILSSIPVDPVNIQQWPDWPDDPSTARQKPSNLLMGYFECRCPINPRWSRPDIIWRWAQNDMPPGWHASATCHAVITLPAPGF